MIKELELSLEYSKQSCIYCKHFESWYNIFMQDKFEPKDQGECKNKLVVSEEKYVGYNTTCKLFENE